MNHADLAASRAESAAIWWFSQHPASASWVLTTHVPNELGHCLGCHTQMSPILHPCVVRRLAQDAISRSIPRPREATP